MAQWEGACLAYLGPIVSAAKKYIKKNKRVGDSSIQTRTNSLPMRPIAFSWGASGKPEVLIERGHVTTARAPWPQKPFEPSHLASASALCTRPAGKSGSASGCSSPGGRESATQGSSVLSQVPNVFPDERQGVGGRSMDLQMKGAAQRGLRTGLEFMGRGKGRECGQGGVWSEFAGGDPGTVACTLPLYFYIKPRVPWTHSGS